MMLDVTDDLADRIVYEIYTSGMSVEEMLAAEARLNAARQPANDDADWSGLRDLTDGDLRDFLDHRT